MSKRRRTARRPRTGARQRTAPLALVPAPGPTDPGASRPATTGPTDLGHQQIQMLIGLIATGGLDEHPSAISAALGERHHHLQRAQSNQAAAQIDIGDRVRVGHTVRPLYLHGAAGTVIGWAGQRVVVQLDQPIGRCVTGQVCCPPLGLEPLPT